MGAVDGSWEVEVVLGIMGQVIGYWMVLRGSGDHSLVPYSLKVLLGEAGGALGACVMWIENEMGVGVQAGLLWQ